MTGDARGEYRRLAYRNDAELTAWNDGTLIAWDWPLLRGCELGFFFLLLRGFNFGGFFLDQLDEVVDDVGVFQAVVGDAADIDLVGAVAAAGEADVGLARLARAVDDAADDRKRSAAS